MKSSSQTGEAHYSGIEKSKRDNSASESGGGAHSEQDKVEEEENLNTEEEENREQEKQAAEVDIDEERQAALPHATHYSSENLETESTGKTKAKSCNDISNNKYNAPGDSDEELETGKKVSIHILKGGSQKRGKKLFYKLKHFRGSDFSKSMDIMEGSKRIMKIKTKKHNFRKQQVKLSRDSEPLIAVLTWGVSQSVRELENVPIPPIFMSSDFKAHWKIKKENHNFNKQNMPSHFKFKEYCPLVFKKLRQLFNYNDERFEEIVQGISPTETAPCLSDEDPENPNSTPNTSFPTNFDNEDENRTGINSDCDLYPQLPLLHYSQDRSLVIKFVSSDNIAEMHSFLPKYYRHIVEQGANTLLPRYVAMYRLSTSSSSDGFDKHGKGYYAILMENMFSRHLKIHRQYDLKGSTVGRQANQSEKQNGTLFDKDFIQANEKISLEQNGKEQFLSRLHSDVEFLSDCKIISYSLLLGIHDRTRQDSTIRRVASGGSPSDPNCSDKGYESPDNQILIPGDRIGDANLAPPSESQSSNLLQAQTQQIIGGVRRLSATETNMCNYEFKSAEDDNQHIYYCGLIDCMSDYDAQKRMAHAIKSRRHANAEISTVKPEKYKIRFLDFVKDQVLWKAAEKSSSVVVNQSAEL